MKKIMLTSFSFFTFLFFAKAQIQKGTYTMRPAVYFSRQLKSTDISGYMDYGRFIGEQFLISGGISGSSFDNGSIKNIGAGVNLHYYYLPDAKLNPYILSGLSFSRMTFANNLTTFTSINSGSNISQRASFNQLDASIGTGVQYFINENIALDAQMNFTALGITQKNSKKLYQQVYSFRLQPFYSSSSYKAAKEINNFFYKGKTEIFGSLAFAPKTIGAIGGSSTFYMGVAGSYSLNKIFAAGASFSYWNSSKINNQLGLGLSAETNIKLLKRLYLSPNLGFGYEKLKQKEANLSVNTNLSTKFFINKNIAWTANFLSIPLYRSQKSSFPQEKIFFNNSFVYYLK